MSTASCERTIRVALVGLTGVGKSTLVNVLKGERAAAANNDAVPCTTRTTQYELVEGRTKYCIWDTMGLDEAIPKFKLGKPVADNMLKQLLCNSNPRIDLILFCINATKIWVKEHWKVLGRIQAVLGKEEIKVAVVVMRAGKNLDLQSWKTTCQATAEGVVKKFPSAELIETVPEFGRGVFNFSDPEVKDCRHKILHLVSEACPEQQSMESGLNITSKYK